MQYKKTLTNILAPRYRWYRNLCTLRYW